MTEFHVVEPPQTSRLDNLDDEHVEFIKTFQPAFDTFYSTRAAKKRGSQKQWVLKNVLGEFIRKFGVPLPAVATVSFL